MADSTTNLDEISSSQASKEITANALLDAASPATLYGRRASTTAGLTFGYYGGRINIAGVPTAIANGTVALTASNTNYVVAARATGAVSASTATTNWNSSAYIRLYSIVAGASTITSYVDHRALMNAESPYGALQYQSGWNAATNTPALADGVGTKGYYYVVSVAGSTTLDGWTGWTVGDIAIFNGTTWDKLEGGGISAGEIAAVIHAATGKTTPVDADEFALADSAASFALKLVTWANIKATLASWLETLTATWSNKTLTAPTINGGSSDFTTLKQLTCRVPYILPVGAGFVGLLPSGNSADDGVVTLDTALPTGVTKLFGYLPTSALYAGSAAGRYYGEQQSGAVWKFYNNLYTGGPVEYPASPTAFVCTGSGAYTQTTGAAIELPSITTPANAPGDTGSLEFASVFLVPGNTNTKTLRATFGATEIVAQAMATGTWVSANISRSIKNTDAGHQIVGGGVITALPVLGTEDTTAAVDLALTGQLAVATDYVLAMMLSATVSPQ